MSYGVSIVRIWEKIEIKESNQPAYIFYHKGYGETLTHKLESE